MDFENAKENIQPLATGRNASILQASLCSPQELLAQRQNLEDEIKNYVGDDPLEPWYAYICWIEQSYPSAGNESGLQRVLRQCLVHFENDDKYKQDRRLIKLFIKLILNQKDQLEAYQEMYNNGIGTMVADFYIAWAYSYDMCGNTRKADEVFRRGIACRAVPIEDLKEAHHHFGYTMAQRILYTDGTDEAEEVIAELNERRLALQSLRHRQKGKVGSVRTGTAIKSQFPGVIANDGPSTSGARNVGKNIEIFNDENRDHNTPMLENIDQVEEEREAGKSTLRSIIDANRHQENIKESGPWNKAHTKNKHNKIFADNIPGELGFTIHVDEDETKFSDKIVNYEKYFDKPFVYPMNFVAKNKRQDAWVTPVTLEDQPDENTIPHYNKCMLYPRPNMEFQPEEYRAYCFFNRQNKINPFVECHYKYWASADPNVNVRQYPNFAKQSKQQNLDDLDRFEKPPTVEGMQVDIHKLYDESEQIEYQFEELLSQKWRKKHNETIHSLADMEETVCLAPENLKRRKSFFPTDSRKSIAPMIHSKISSSSEITLPSVEMDKMREENVFVQPENIKPILKQHVNPPIITNSTVATSMAEKGVTPSSEPNITTISEKKVVVFEDSPKSESVQGNNAPSGSLFDADETCSTQMFNIFIKKQSVSTPKAIQKQAPQRQFGTLLKDPTPELEFPKPPEDTQTSDDTVNALRKQLSTILETSEHGTTQGTHSSGGTNATTKSTITSPNELMQKTKVAQSTISAGASTIIGQTPTIPRMQRHLSQIFETECSATTIPKHQTEKNDVGNFSRLEQIEISPPVIKNINPLRFQEDKTETITKSVMRFQEDKTETISQVVLPTVTKFESEQHTANISKQVPNLPNIADDSFDFFTKSPEKANTQPKYDIRTPLAQSNPKRLCNLDTPEMITNPQRNIFEKPKNTLTLFEDESLCEMGIKLQVNNETNDPSKGLKNSVLQDSFLPEFSLIESSQPKQSDDLIVNEEKKTNKNKLQDSFMQNLSFVPETQEIVRDDVREKSKQALNTFEIYLDETIPDAIVKPKIAKCTMQTETFSNPQSTENQIYLDNTSLKIQDTSSKPLNEISLKKVHQKFSGEVDKENELSQSIRQNSKDGDLIIQNQTSFKKLPMNLMEITGGAHLTASFMKDLAEISKKPTEIEEDSKPSHSTNLAQMINGNSTLNFLNGLTAAAKQKSSDFDSKNMKQIDFFEFNAATEMFATNVSSIKNSTLLPTFDQQSTTQPKEKSDEQNSFCIYEDLITNTSKTIKLIEPSKSEHFKTDTTKILTKRSKSPQPTITLNKENHIIDNPIDNFCDLSIYYKKTPRTPKESQHIWEDDDFKTPDNKKYFHSRQFSLEESIHVIDRSLADVNVNPFKADLIQAFLEDVEFTQYIEKLPNCQLVGHVKRLTPNSSISIKNETFSIIKMIGEGSYGTVYSAIHKNGKKYAIKQQRPPNHWEYNICLEIQSRLANDEMLLAYMSVDYALIGNNSSILVSKFSKYGSLIAVCNKIKKHTTKNVDEFVVMHLTCQLLSIIDHLHAIKIIHADVKADNFLLMRPLSYPSDGISLQLIDFGVSIDMERFPVQQTFNYVHSDKDMKCIEMRTGRPWSYQLDLFGLAGVIHVLLFGKYMEVEQRSQTNYWMQKERLPRYFNKTVWESIFQTLLNIRNSSSMPNLQELRTMLKSEMHEKEKYVANMIKEFNLALS